MKQRSGRLYSSAKTRLMLCCRAIVTSKAGLGKKKPSFINCWSRSSKICCIQPTARHFSSELKQHRGVRKIWDWLWRRWRGDMTKFFRTTEKRCRGWVATIARWKWIMLHWGSINNCIVRASAGMGPLAKVRENTRKDIQWERTRATLKSQWGDNFQTVCRRQLRAISTKRLRFCRQHKALWRHSTQKIWVPILPK